MLRTSSVGGSSNHSSITRSVNVTYFRSHFSLPAGRNRRQQAENLSLLEQMAQTPAGHAYHDNAGYLRHTMMDALVTEKKFQKVLANYQTQIKDKLGVSTSAALVHIALRHGVVKPPG